MKKNLPLYVLFACLLINLNVFGQLVKPTQSGSKYTITLANINFEVDASYGARISSVKVDNNEILYLAGYTGDYLWGSTFWYSPQSDWVWPPSTSLDRGEYIGGIDGNILSFDSYKDDLYNTGLRFMKTFYGDIADTSITIVYSIINNGTIAQSHSLWEITRVPPAGGIAFFPRGKGGFEGNDSASYHFENINNIEWYVYNGAGGFCHIDGSEGWSAWINSKKVLFVKKFQDVPYGSNAPGEGEIQMYYGTTYLELENQGKYSNIEVNDTLQWTMKWYLRNIPTSIKVEKGDSTLVNYARNLGKYKKDSALQIITKSDLPKLLVYPNPADTYLRVDGLKEKARIKIFDLLGKLVLEKEINSSNNTVSLISLKSGFCTYQIITAKNKYSGKILINKR